MPNTASPRIAIVDYGMGNLFSVQQACETAGLGVIITSSRVEISAADGVVLPGVGAFGVAMETLNRLDLVSALRDYAASGKPLLGICLGMQLLMTESQEFGVHRGLGIVDGEVVRLEEAEEGGRRLKIPQVGWNRIHSPCPDGLGGPENWRGTPLQGLSDGEFMYFVHSFHAEPQDNSGVLSTTQYGPGEFCSSFTYGSIAACQFHPERSGPKGLQIYQNLARMIRCPAASVGVKDA